jgi:negative regulator of flagellin synthesis FlgM
LKLKLGLAAGQFMKITKRPPSISGGKSVSTAQGASVRKSTQVSTASNVDKLQIAASTTQLRELEAQLAKLDISDAAKVAAIKRAIDNGTFEVNSVLVADRLIDTAKEAVRKRPRKQ